MLTLAELFPDVPKGCLLGSDERDQAHLGKVDLRKIDADGDGPTGLTLTPTLTPTLTLIPKYKSSPSASPN